MSIIRFKIDEKSLFYGIYNDYVKGQTATVHTPLNQSKDEEKWHLDIMELFKYDNLNKINIPDRLRDICVPKTTSNANSEIDYFYEFDDIYLDGTKLDCDCGFGMYVKRETDRVIVKRDGTLARNTHFGRLKLHYPTSLRYRGDGFNIDNKAVLEKILEANGGFAFIVRGFEVDTDKQTLNFVTSMVGIKGVHLSMVFQRQKGVGKKLLLEESHGNVSTNKILTLEDELLVQDDYQSVSDDTDFELLRQIQAKNGSKGEEYVLNNLEKIVGGKCREVFHTSAEFKKSPYDIEYIDEAGIKQYLEVKSTSTGRKVFNMSKYEINFMQKYETRYLLVLVSEVNNAFPTINKYRRPQILNMRKEYPTTRFFA